MAKKKTVKKISLKEKIWNIVNSLHSVIIGLILILILLVWFVHHLMSSNQTFLFNGHSEKVNILNGVISLNHDMHVFVGSDIAFIYSEDIKVVSYSIGYFLPRGLDMMPLIIISGESEEGISLRGVLQSGSAFNIMEASRNEMFFNKESISRLDNGLYFIIEAITEDGENILEKIPMNLTRVSR